MYYIREWTDVYRTGAVSAGHPNCCHHVLHEFGLARTEEHAKFIMQNSLSVPGLRLDPSMHTVQLAHSSTSHKICQQEPHHSKSFV